MDTTYGYNANNLLKNGQPWFPVMGEFHYSRYHKALWEESLRKIKACGVSVVSSYVIWIHHEEEEGVFDFDGCRDIGAFVALCKKVGISVFLRLGPFVHGEVRNGGLPDWIIEKGKQGLRLRSNDGEYLNYVRRFWTQVYAQLRDCIAGEDSPVLGIQIENEYGQTVKNDEFVGDSHIRALTAMAGEIGFRAPLHTATGWGGACIGDLLPVMGGYCDAPWDPRTCELEPNNNFVFSHIRNDALIACDHPSTDVNRYDETRFPFLTAELGGGLQVTAHRRPVATGKDIGAMSTVKLGSGAALLGYYMFHGGSNPRGKRSTLQESRATGYPNDLPEINYDFNAPIRQYGTISDNYREIKRLAYFLRDFGADMAALPAEIPSLRILPGNTDALRTACRHDGDHGYVFFNNYQRRKRMADHPDVQLNGWLGEPDEDGTAEHRDAVRFPKLDIRNGMYGFFPYNMKLGNAVLRRALATPLCQLQTTAGSTYVFYGDQPPRYSWVGEAANVLSLSGAESLNAWKVTLEQDYLLLSDNYVWEENGVLKVAGGLRTRIRVYPEPAAGIRGFDKCGVDGRFTVYERNLPGSGPRVEAALLAEEPEKKVYRLKMGYALPPAGDSSGAEYGFTRHDVFLTLRYLGKSLEIFSGEQKIEDHFYTGQPVPLSLGYFDFPSTLTVVVNTLRKSDDIYLEKKPEFDAEGCVCELSSVEIADLYD